MAWAQPWTYDFGTGTGSWTSGASTTFLPTPSSGTARVRVGGAGGGFYLQNPGLASLGSETELKITAPTSTSANKFSIYDYTASKTFFIKFDILLGDSNGSNTATSGAFYFFQGDGAQYSDNNTFTGTQVFTGIQWSFGTSGTITTNYRNAGSWSALGSTPFAQGNVYTVEIYGNNSTSSATYYRQSSPYTVAANKQDIWVNGSLIGDDLAKAQLANDANIDSFLFYGVSSTNNVANCFLDNITYSNMLPTAGGTPTITVNPATLTGFSYAQGSGPSSEKTFTVQGSNLTADINITVPTSPAQHYEISKTSGGTFSSSLTLTQSGGTVSETTIYVRLKAGLSAGNYNNETITVSSTGATSKTVTCSGTVCKPEPSNHCTNFTAANGTDPKTQITLSWTDATGSIIPDGYLIKAATGDYSNIANPVDGTAETDGTLVKNIAAGVQTATFSNLNSSTTYYFKIFPYTNSGTNINYKTDGTVPQISWTTASGPTIVEIILPQYIQGKNGTNNQRLPWACRLRLENLTASATYRYFGQFVVSTDNASTNGAGIGWFVNADNTITRNEILGMSTAGTFTTDANGSYTGWFMGEPSGNDRFTPGNKLYYRIMLNNGAGGSIVAMRLTTANSIKVINFGTSDDVNQGTFLYGVSRSPAKNFVFVYDNVEGTGRPIAGSIIENDGLDLSNVTQILPSYKSKVDNFDGAWGVIIPNSVGAKGFSGIKRIESRNLSDGSLYAQATDSDGVWPSGAITVNPRGGDGTPLVLNENDATLPVELSSFTANINSQGGITVMWATQSETGVNGYYVNRATVNNLSEALRISSLIPASNTSQQQVYVYNDNELYEPGTYYYWLEIQDIDGVVSYYGSRSVTFGGNGNNGTPEIPLVTGIRSIYPNPFNPSATIMYELEQPANVNIEIFNNRGQIVRSFNFGQQEKNRYKLLWDGTDNSGSACGTGIYFIKMKAGKETFVKKAALVK
jgi:hypothetical protein